MLTVSEVNGVAEKAASSALKRVGLSHVYTEPTIDSAGHDAFTVTVVLKRGTFKDVTGRDAMRVIVNISQALETSGEDRLAIVRFATEEELEAELNGEPEL
jgi:hypothetical protein